MLFNPHGKQEEEEIIVFEDLSHPDLEKHIGESAARELRHDVELLETVYPSFKRKIIWLVKSARYFWFRRE